MLEDLGDLVLGPPTPPLFTGHQGGRIHNAALEPAEKGSFTDREEACNGRIGQSIPGH